MRKTIADHLYDLQERKDKSVTSRVAELRGLAQIANYLADKLIEKQEKAPT